MYIPCMSVIMIFLSYEPVSRQKAFIENRTVRHSPEWGRKLWIPLDPLMSYSITLPSSWPEARRRPEGSTHTEAKALPGKKEERIIPYRERFYSIHSKLGSLFINILLFLKWNHVKVINRLLEYNDMCPFIHKIVINKQVEQ